jgi:DmsE family decaheme c-type cytochrome
MNLWQKTFVLLVFGAALSAAAPSFAADSPQVADQRLSNAAPVTQSLAKDAVCTKCHDESETKPVLSIYKTRHGVKADGRTPSCQSCHGASDAHVNNPAGTSVRPPVDISFGAKDHAAPQAQADTCLSCHQGGQRTHWAGSQHQSRDIACSSCHQVHTQNDRVLTKISQPEVCFTCHKTERAQIHRTSTHPLAAGKMGCSDCHNPHGTTGPSLLAKNSVNDTCYTCHAEKRGPFLWEHEPVTEACTNCHTPHGSNNAPLLKVRQPYLCQQCHVADHSRTLYSGANLVGGNAATVAGTQANRILQSPNAQAYGCSQCHSQVHGSNHPAGALLLR